MTLRKDPMHDDSIQICKDFIKWREGDQSLFRSGLWDLCLRANDEELNRLRWEFPIEVNCFEMWRLANTKEDFMELIRKECGV